MSEPTLQVTGEEEADELLRQEPLALLIGMLLDQQMPIERAFVAPYRLQERTGRPLDAAGIGGMDPSELEAAFRQPPALHRYWGSMAKRTQTLCRFVADTYGGDAGAIWRGVDSGTELFERVLALPGYGEQKAKIFVAMLAKRFGIRPEGWEQVTSPYSDDQPRSVADIDSRETLQQVRAFKKALRSQAKADAGN